MTITITAFEASPDKGRGLARDMPVRWALEEVGQAYEVRLVSFAAMKGAAHRARQPFGQIPTFEDGTVSLFESGAIVLHIAETWPGLLPADPAARASARSWLFAALSTLEPVILEREVAGFLERDKPWHAERMPGVEARIRARLEVVSGCLGAADWLGPAFSAGDLMMVTVLRRLKSSGFLADYANLAAYVARAEERPAFQRAFAAQLDVFRRSEAGL
jgi:glutathione S-transferase